MTTAMFREGGWAVPLQCDSPILQSWLGTLKWFCSFLGVPCDTYINPELGVCPSKWSPLTITGTAAIFTALLLLFLTVAAKQFLRWLSSRRGSTMAAIATAAAAELRKANPELYPPAPHCWYRLAGEQLRKPMLCVVCQDRLQPEADAKRVHCCEVCGVVSHESCVRKVPHDCRPAAEAGDRMLHLWKPAGVVMYDSEEEVAEGSVQVCLYCQNPCEADLFAQEPVWSCAWCRATAHVRCFLDFHTDAGSAAVSEAESAAEVAQDRVNSSSEAGPLSGARLSPRLGLGDLSGHQPPPRRNGRKHRRHKSAVHVNGVAASGPTANGVSVADTRRIKSGLSGILRASTSDPGWRTMRRPSIGSFLNTLAAAVSGADPAAEEDLDDVRPRAGPRQPGDVDVTTLDTCTFGPHRRLVLPPTAVRLIPGDSWSDRAKSFLRGASKKKKKAGHSKAPSSGAPQGMGGTQRVASWWGEPQVPWSSYRIEQVPPGCRPLLVFLNTRSGPQMGTRLRRRLLRLLNPIQVVELPKERPEEPLELFANVPNLQILVMGGDGTAGWILSCLDAIQEQRALLPDPQVWSPPPVAVLPLGTGNDLARCLNWGGGLYTIKQRGLAAVLHDVEHGIVALLDRWNVRIDAAPPPASPMSPLHRMGSLSHAEPPKGVCKAMNNYLGIGVDARAALDFHTLRESYPSWFCSQMGNKLWYTTVGAKDILGHASRGLARKLEVECDGRRLELPEDIEGLLLLNINSYMGGVDLWASGASLPGRSPHAKQSFCDGRLELVAVYGSWHLGQLQVGLSRAIRLTQCSSVHITTREPLPMQIDGEPFLQAPATLQVDLKAKAFMLRRLESEPLSRMAHVVADALEESVDKGIINPAQRHAITVEIAARLHPVL